MATSPTATSPTWITNKAVREHPTPLTAEQAAARRKGAVRTAWIVAGLAVAVYVAFLLTGILGR